FSSTSINLPSDTVPLYEKYSASLSSNSVKSIVIEASPSSTVIDKLFSSKEYSPGYVAPLNVNVTSPADSKSSTGVLDVNLTSLFSASSSETVGLGKVSPRVLPSSSDSSTPHPATAKRTTLNIVSKILFINASP